ncbi:MAG: restriction endonuclease [Phycisphaerales bacterium]|nr:restriction endonuclease [Phycisphaerales bacterium]
MGVQIVRESLGVVTSEGAQSGIVVTSGQFTAEATDSAAKNPIRLIDGRELVQMISDVQASGRIETERIEEDSESARASAPICPQCGAVLIPRTAKRGVRAGSKFLGCSTFPNCNYTRDIATYGSPFVSPRNRRPRLKLLLASADTIHSRGYC